MVTVALQLVIFRVFRGEVPADATIMAVGGAESGREPLKFPAILHRTLQPTVPPKSQLQASES